MVIKYKAKYIRDGQVVIDDSSLIELASSTSIDDIAHASLPENNIAKDKADVESEERDTELDSDTKPKSTEP